MRRWRVVSLVVSLIVLVLLAAPVAAQQSGGPTVSQLQQALLTEDDLVPSAIPGDWFLFDAAELAEDHAAVYADFADTDADDYLAIELHDARNGVPDYLAIRLFADLMGDIEVNQLTQIAATGYGTDGARYKFNYDLADERWYGEVAAWRQGSVSVAILIESLDADACVCDAAKLQHDKLAATIP